MVSDDSDWTVRDRRFRCFKTKGLCAAVPRPGNAMRELWNASIESLARKRIICIWMKIGISSSFEIDRFLAIGRLEKFFWFSMILWLC